MIHLLHPLPKRIPPCECGAAATHYAESFLAGGFYCDECAVVKAAESWAGINDAAQSIGLRLERTAEGYIGVPDTQDG